MPLPCAAVFFFSAMLHYKHMFIIHLARVYGFCRGVQKACEKADELIAGHPGENVYSIGKLVHNDMVVSEYERRGLCVINSPDSAPAGIALIRAHGIPEEEKKAYLDRGFTLADGTCRLVLHNHELSAASTLDVLYFGIHGHAETISTVSNVKTHFIIIENESDLELVDPAREYNVVIQTTFSSAKEERFRQILADRGVKVNYLNKICAASERRRAAVRELCRQCDTVFVIGERQSANTMELYRIAASLVPRCWLIGSSDDITDEMLDSCSHLGLCAGASVSPRHVSSIEAFLISRGGCCVRSLQEDAQE